MLAKQLVIALATGLLFGGGVGASALADEPPIPTEPTTTAPTTTTATTSSTTTSTETEAATSPETGPSTSTETTNNPPDTTISPGSTVPESSAPREATRARAQIDAHEARRSETPPRGQPAPSQRRKHRHRISKPLAVTPPLGLDGYVFPVTGMSSYGDSYGAFRGDVHGKWHHGDDIFAPLGTPVVAVASGTINRVGWHKIGGWRLWVRDAAANEFYYAHLSGYAPSVFHSRYVRAGDVLGFVGTTGDAFGGPAHLHFEVHPHQLLRRRYDGAVDPTTYLADWPHVRPVDAPFPVHPRFPRAPRPRSEARLVFHQLLMALRSTEQPTSRIQQPTAVSRAHHDTRPPPRVLSLGDESASPKAAAVKAAPAGPLLAGLLIIGFFVATAVLVTTVLGRALRDRAS